MVKMGSGKVCVLVIAALGLSGCGTSGSAPPDGIGAGGNAPQDGIDAGMEDVPEAPKSYAGLAADMDDLIADLSLLDQASAMPASGEATFNGVAGFELGVGAGEFSFVSRFDLAAKFADATVSGQLFNFTRSVGAQMPGTVEVENGVIAGNILNFDMNGSLINEGQVVVVAGKGQGAFAGEGLAGVLGGLEGTWTEGANPASPITGIFAATRVP